MIRRLQRAWYGWRFRRDGILRGPDSEMFELKTRINSLEADNKRLERYYKDLIMQVGNKYPSESRHDTAKRYIIQAENGPGNLGSRLEVTDAD